MMQMISATSRWLQLMWTWSRHESPPTLSEHPSQSETFCLPLDQHSPHGHETMACPATTMDAKAPLVAPSWNSDRYCTLGHISQ